MEIVKAVANGCDLGDLSLSKQFPDKRRRFVAQEIREKKVNFISTRLVQTGFLSAINLQADKGTTVHNTHQFTRVAVVVPDSECLISNIYLGQPIVKNRTRRGIAESMTKQLELFKTVGSQVEGGFFDGQYFH